MTFKTPNNDITFEIPNDWWNFPELANFSRNKAGYYLYQNNQCTIEIVPICEVEPPKRSEGVPWFEKRNLMPILFGFQDGNCQLPPVEVKLLSQSNGYKYELKDGFHRYYASVAVGYTQLPVHIREA